MLRVGTDCSGIEAPIQALKKLKIPFSHVFSSDINSYCISSIKANYEPDILFGDSDGDFPNGDITQRRTRDIPEMDLYVCGFPCQPFSIAGKRGGFNDKRGNVFFTCIKVIRKKMPKYFVLENVKGLIRHDKGNTFCVILSELKKLKNYHTDYKVLNTKDYGIPQSRSRVFIVGVRKDLKKTFSWPKHKPMKSLEDFVDYNDKTVMVSKSLNENVKKNAIFIDTAFVKIRMFSNSDIISPCLVANGSLYNFKLKRRANIKEYLKLQGFPSRFKQVVSNSQMKRQIGNSMSVNVLVEIFRNLLL